MILNHIPHLAVLTFLYIAVWSYVFRLKEFLIDDDHGIAPYSDRWDEKAQKVIDSYEDGGRTFKHGQFNPNPGMPGSVIRWLRILWGRTYKVVGKTAQGHDVYGYVQSPLKHHALSFIVHYANIILAYLFLTKLFGGTVAFFTCVLFLCHPITVMAVAWISGIGYLLSLLFALITFNLSFALSGQLLTFSTLATSYISCAALLSGFANWIILLATGHKEAAIASFLVSMFLMMTYGKKTVDHRKNAFTEQNMGHSTTINWRKPIVIVKTVYYYFKMLIFPKRLGLFHTWGYHFDETLERVDSMFWKGITSLAGLGTLAYFAPDPVRFGILWMLAYLVLFSNVITAQQFVVDRYAFISSLGFCLIAAWYLAPYPEIFWTLTGIYIMRSWVHLPTFKSQIHFYESNIFNFPDSEVAYGNLGVIYSQKGRMGSGQDCWNKALAMNPHYDVPAYNLYSLFRSNGMLEMAKDYLQKCLNAKTVHFKARWEEEMKDLDRHIEIKKKVDDLNAKLNEAVKTGAYEAIHPLRDAIIAITNPSPPKP